MTRRPRHPVRLQPLGRCPDAGRLPAGPPRALRRGDSSPGWASLRSTVAHIAGGHRPLGPPVPRPAGRLDSSPSPSWPRLDDAARLSAAAFDALDRLVRESDARATGRPLHLPEPPGAGLRPSRSGRPSATSSTTPATTEGQAASKLKRLGVEPPVTDFVLLGHRADPAIQVKAVKLGDFRRCRVGRASGEPHHPNSLVGLARGSTHPTFLHPSMSHRSQLEGPIGPGEWLVNRCHLSSFLIRCGTGGTTIVTSMSISPSDDIKAFVAAQVDEEGYASASEYLQALLRDVRMRKARRDLEAKLDEALTSGPSRADDARGLRISRTEGLGASRPRPAPGPIPMRMTTRRPREPVDRPRGNGPCRVKAPRAPRRSARG